MSGGFKYIETNKVSKAQKRRDQKAAKKAEQLKRIEDGEKLDEHKDRRIEQERLNSLLNKLGLKVYDIDADGDCLFKAVEHQLSLDNNNKTKLDSLSHLELRQKTSQYMLENADNFMPYLLNDQGDLMDSKEYEQYCNKIAKTKEWGGHLELTAISHLTGKPIHIYQAESKKPISIEPPQVNNTNSAAPPPPPILLSFHKHLYHLGEHYNSLIEIK